MTVMPYQPGTRDDRIETTSLTGYETPIGERSASK